MIVNLQLIKKKDLQSLNCQDYLSLVKKSRSKVEESVTIVEKTLISKLKAGDSSAFTIIFTAFYKDFVLFAARFTKDINNAEEIVQDTFVRLWEEHEFIDINVSLKSYLLKTIKNRCIDLCRHNRVIKEHSDYVLNTSLQFDFNTEYFILHSELQVKIDEVLNKLPEEVSEAFRMNRYKGLRYQEIAELLYVSVRTIEVRIGKALHQLRSHLKEYFPVFIFIFSMLFTDLFD